MDALVDECPLPALLVSLPLGEILVANNPAGSLLLPDSNGESGSTLVGRRLGDVLGDPSSLEALLAMLSAGQLDSFCRRQIRPGRDGTLASAHVTVTASPARANDDANRAFAVVQHSPDEFDGGTPGGMTWERGQVIGIVDRQWRLTQLSASVRALLGDETLDNDPAVTAHLHPDDNAKLLMAVATLAAGQHHSSFTGRVRAAGGRWVACHLTVAALDTEPPPAFAFVASPAHTRSVPDPCCDGHRSEYTQRIATVASLADADDPAGVAALQLSKLTKREREVVSLLLSGDDVSDIAAGLFIAPSTVRNHLASSFRKLGVRSQRELLRRVRQANVAYP